MKRSTKDRVIDFSRIAANIGADLGDVDIVIMMGVSLKDGSLTMGSASKLDQGPISEGLLIKILDEAVRLLRSGDA